MNLNVIRRDDVTFELTFRDNDGELFDLTGSTVFFTVKRRLSDTDNEAVITKQITSFDEPESGIALLTLNREETDLIAKSYFYDIQLKDSSGKIVSSDRGKFTVTQDVTIRTDSSESS